MSQQITEAFVKQYNAGVRILAQQKEARIAGRVRFETQNGESQAFEFIGQVEMTRRIGRHSDTILGETPHSRRWVFTAVFDYSDMVDTPDKNRMLFDPTSNYAMVSVAAANRRKDIAVLEAATATAKAGQQGTTDVPFPASQRIEVASTGLTLAKLIEAREKREISESDDEKWYIALSAKQMTNLLNTTEITNSDFNTIKTLVNGEVNTFMGFEFIRTELVRFVTGSTDVRECIAFSQNGLLLSESEGIRVVISRRADKNNNWQVSTSIDVGATRMEESRVIAIDCLEV